MRRTACLTLALLAAAPVAARSHVWTGRFDWTSLPAYGAWQSVDSDEQAVGLSKHLWTLARDTQPLLSLGVFVGVKKPLLSPPVTVLGGSTVAVPGSALDWALGTKWGAAWLPKLKTGMMFSHDLSRPRQLHLKPDFIGIGASYPIGG
jgi:hypothetical protein